MPQSITSTVPATPRERLADVRGSQAKAERNPQLPATRLREVAAEAIRRVSSQKAAAMDIGIHQGRLSHKLTDGSLTLAQLEALGPDVLAALGAELQAEYGALSDPKAHARKLIRTIEGCLQELRSYVEVA